MSINWTQVPIDPASGAVCRMGRNPTGDILNGAFCGQPATVEIHHKKNACTTDPVNSPDPHPEEFYHEVCPAHLKRILGGEYGPLVLYGPI